MPFTIVNNGDPSRTRTCDPVVKSHLLYRLSYRTTSRGNQELICFPTEFMILQNETALGKFRVKIFSND